ncbi:leucyl aminopeptidase family protein [Pararhodobacter sp. SW119]|uniref:leucyl aminopeptidase family protein n=1 Tax=Pararhodobacter sp. SW119 TaxID=2780075 RepID=UPI001ADF3EDC|nr:leucyl aminopeptidase family protein [Pararhodobacter sp. SW119]
MPIEPDFADGDSAALPLHALRAEDLADWRQALPDAARDWVDAAGFSARIGQVVLVPDGSGKLVMAAAGLGDAAARRRTRFALAAARAKLPARDFRLDCRLTDDDLDEQVLGWLLAGYRFDRYRKDKPPARAQLVAPAGVDTVRLARIAQAEALTRDLINTPAADLGPEELETAMRDLAATHGADLTATTGYALLGANLPLIHAVGRASPRAPRLLDLRWGTDGPRLTLVGKGVCFDTGGLNLKPGASMGLMKKDMGGAATVLGLAQMIMATGWKVRLRVLVPAVENAVAGVAFRPGDILTARDGQTVEVNNTDAEGRLVLADALALADEEAPDAIICMATLTGAARVALGPDLPPLYTDDEPLAAALARAAAAVRDPVWRMPFHDPYEPLIEPGIADLDNAPSGGMAGSITAALFLRRFVRATPRFAHFDIYGWQQKDAPARPKGGVGQGARALFAALPSVLNLS